MQRLLATFVIFFLFEADPSFAQANNMEELVANWRADSSTGTSSLVDSFLAASPSLHDTRSFLGELRRHYSGEAYADLVFDIVYSSVQRRADNLDRADQRDLARALRLLWRRHGGIDAERVFLTVIHLSQSNPRDRMEFYFNDAVSLVPNIGEAGRIEVVRTLLVHYSAQLEAIREDITKIPRNDVSAWANMGVLLQFPNQLFEQVKSDISSSEEGLLRDSDFHFAAKNFEKEYEKTLRAFFSQASSAQEYIFAAKLEVPNVAETQGLYADLLLEFAPRFAQTSPSFRDFSVYIQRLGLSGNDSSDAALRPLINELTSKDQDLQASLREFLQRLNSLDAVDSDLKIRLQKVAARVLDHCKEAISSIRKF